MNVPTERVALRIARDVLGGDPRSAARFPTGLHHFVYDVVMATGEAVVVRIGARESRDHLAGALFWEERLRPLGVPLPALLHADLSLDRFEFPFLVLERLPGTDLGNVYGELSARQRSTLAAQMVDLQHRASRLPEASGFGYALDYSGRLASRWSDVLRGSLRRGARWIERARVADPVWVGRVESAVARIEPDLGSIAPKAFLHDITTKNVIVADGTLTGIVDVDSMAFGDPLWTVALTRMSLLASHNATDYIDAWCEAMELESPRLAVLDVYTALHGLTFLGELGHAFNREAPEPVDPTHRDHLTGVVARLTR